MKFKKYNILHITIYKKIYKKDQETQDENFEVTKIIFR